MKSHKRPSIKKLVAILLAMLLAGFIAFKVYSHYKDTPSDTITSGATAEQVKEEEAANAASKAAIINDSKPSDNNSPPPTSIKSSVVISSATSSGVSAYVTGVFEEEGACTVTATQDSKSYTKTSTGFQNASYTQCAPIIWDAALTSGTWSIVVIYESKTTNSSQSTTIKV